MPLIGGRLLVDGKMTDCCLWNRRDPATGTFFVYFVYFVVTTPAARLCSPKPSEFLKSRAVYLEDLADLEKMPVRRGASAADLV